ncbi:hypothetical protein BDV35DRAFT_324757 [Aspergillus flavus]|uniref:Uncharacterized protein n=1 Tax=Aspergillus flavus TaxID=5059 RepID=A0A5N6GQP0_ASPFL|nr:hypothetical protein BDV35DRAFT_324757 [Aspergillus flavus]
MNGRHAPSRQSERAHGAWSRGLMLSLIQTCKNFEMDLPSRAIRPIHQSVRFLFGVPPAVLGSYIFGWISKSPFLCTRANRITQLGKVPGLIARDVAGN